MARAFASSLPASVVDTIMRFSVGYPRDRLRDLAAMIERTDINHSIIGNPEMIGTRWDFPVAAVSANSTLDFVHDQIEDFWFVFMLFTTTEWSRGEPSFYPSRVEPNLGLMQLECEPCN